ncbi:LOW QUALITY PROTEIN: protein ACCELERATED CELL DEATH 6-like [Asparagus officinalis]|uniref:LOW QUALITY PROTEIN: protein ACCELERATED CELL DEATH 6-like n=1 Tax=Asparagus officinalis TaxID=4686 RepID=UPI00098E0D85|nr:LOW QUALITY PROTEIN: protein ACCELERATED CELL DEATH 6-like [Asparagus officinalis]
MDPQLFRVLKEGNIDMLKTLMQEKPSCLQGITAEKNTPLHLAAGLGYESSVTEILNHHPDLTYSLIYVRCEMNVQNTPLHEAVKQCNLSTSKVLMHEEWRLGHIVNEHGESAVYLAAERGELEIVRMLLQFSARAVGGPDHQTALHAAVCRNSGRPSYFSLMDWLDAIDSCLYFLRHYQKLQNSLMKKLPLISHHVDASESSPIHYAASFGDHKMIQALLLHHDASAAHLLDKDGLSAIHVAATMGYIEVIAEIIKHCPDTIELTDKKQRNFLVVAIENKRLTVVKYVLNNPARFLLDHDIDYVAVQHKIMKRLMSAGSQFSPQCMDLMTKDFYSEDAEEINRYRALSNNLAIVAVLIATVTFAAAFTLPGGYENDGPDRGMAILGKKTTFKAFLISDALAMVSSIIVTCFLIYTGSSDHDVRLHSIRVAMKLMWVAHGGMVVAFATGIYVVVESGRKCISVLICSMACSVPSIAWMMAHCPAFDSLNLVTTRRNQDKKGKETPLL